MFYALTILKRRVWNVDSYKQLCKILTTTRLCISHLVVYSLYTLKKLSKKHNTVSGSINKLNL